MDLEKQVNELMGIDLSVYTDMIVEGIVGYIPKIIGAILVLWIGFKIINLIEKGIDKIMDRQKIAPMLKSFISSLSNMLLKIMVIIVAAGVLGVQTSSFVAMLAAAGFAIGMALSGTLQNFAGGVMILLLKPFKIGHFVEIGGFSGTVKQISIFNTTLLTTDRKRVIIPNSDISNGSMTNYSAEPKRRIDLIIGVSYDDDIDKVKKTLNDIAINNENIIHDDGITIGLIEFADNSVNFTFRFFVKKEDFLNTKFEVLEEIKKVFDKKKISFPFPQRDVHMYNMK
ncbi:MAG: mechanosensitive ion channel [Candidatus Gracilibacteria bacterium]